MRVTDAQGAEFVQRRTLAVHAENRPPVVWIGRLAPPGHVRRLQLGEEAELVVNGDGDDDLVQWAWDLDDDGAFDDGTDSSAKVTFATAGAHRVRARATDAGGLAASAELTFQVASAAPNQAPYVSLATPPGTPRPGVPVTLSASGQDPDGDALTFAWDADGDGAFDDGTGTSVQHTYAQPGSYDVSVQAADGRGGERVALRTVAVRRAVGAGARGHGPLVSHLGPPGAGHRLQRAGQRCLDADVRPRRRRRLRRRPSELAVQRLRVDVPGRDAGHGRRQGHQRREAAPPCGPSRWRRSPRTSGQPSTCSAARRSRPGSRSRCSAPRWTPTAWASSPGRWDLDGDGDFDDSSAGTLTRTFAAGTHSLGLRVTDDDGASAAVTRTFTVGTKRPAASFTVAAGTLRSTSTDPDGGELTAFAWDLDDDGAFDDATGATVDAGFAGNRRVGLKVRDAGGDVGIRYARVDVPVVDPVVTPEPTPTPMPLGDPGPPPPGSKPTATVLSVKGLEAHIAGHLVDGDLLGRVPARGGGQARRRRCSRGRMARAVP